MTRAQMAEWQDHMGIPEGQEWERFAGVPDKAACKTFLPGRPFPPRLPGAKGMQGCLCQRLRSVPIGIPRL